MKPTDLQKSVEAMIDDLFAEEVSKAEENFEVANASKTTADAAIASAPKGEKDEARGAGRPKQISEIPQSGDDGKRAGEYDADISEEDSDKGEEPEEAKKQAKAVTQVSAEGHLGEKPKMKDPRISKSVTDEEYAEFQAFKKSKAADELKKAETLKKAELESIIKSAVGSAVSRFAQENQELKKSLQEQGALIKAMAGQPRQAKSITSVTALEKASAEVEGEQSFSKAEKLDAAEALVMRKALPMEAVVELENTGTVYRRDWQQMIEKELTGKRS